MKIAMIYDFSVNKGGGDYVMLNILNALYDAEYDVELITSNPNGLYESAKLFNEDIPNVNIYEVKTPYFLKHPYTIAYISKKAIKSKNYDIYIVSDDVPRCLSNKRGLCYIHFPHAARFKFHEYMARKYSETLSGKLIWRFHKRLFPKFYLRDGIPKKWLLIANSIVTKHCTSKVFHREDIVILNPPVDSIRINKLWKNSDVEKEDLAVCIGRFELEKNFTDVLYAVASLKNEVKLSLIGFSQSESRLIKLIRKLKLERNVNLLINASRETLINELIKAKAIIHPTPHEPFGIAVVEGMAAGCIPIVKKGFNGPWLEITQERRYGLSFNSVNELSGKLVKAIKCYDNFNTDIIMSRALEFDKEAFKEKFLRILKEMPS